jgi:nucleoside-diphosphate-sugar epimerase
VTRSCLAANRARDELGWEARVALREGLRELITTL